MRKSVMFLMGISVWLLSLVGCSSSSTPTVPDITVIAPSPTVEEGAYPAPTFAGAYPGPDGNSNVLPVTKVVPTAIAPTQDPNLAAVTGRLLLLDESVASVILYLAPIITNESGDQMVRFDRTTSIRTVTDENGNFTFVNVPVGKYGLVLDKVLDSYLLLAPDGDQNLIVDITGKGLIDLGELNYDDLPVPAKP